MARKSSNSDFRCSFCGRSLSEGALVIPGPRDANICSECAKMVVDIAAEAGTSVVAAADGQVYTIYDDDVMGTTVVIRHNGGYTTCYASLSEELEVSVGDTVTMGQVIGTVGETAMVETALGPHVHFSVTYRDVPMDPAEFLALG